MLHHFEDVVEVELRIVEQRQIDVTAPVVFHQHVIDDGGGVRVCAFGECCHAVIGCRFVIKLAALIEAEHAVIALRHDHAEHAHVLGLVGQNSFAHFGLLQFDEAFGERQTREFHVSRARDERMDRALPAEHHAGGAAGDLRGDISTLFARLIGQRQHVAPFFRIDRRLQQRISHRQTRFSGEFLHPHEFVFGGRHVGGHFEDTMTGLTQRTADAHQFFLVGECAGHGYAVFGQMQHGARCRKAERTGFDAFAHDLGHRRHVFGCGRFVARAAITHHIGAHRAVRYLRGDVEHALLAVEAVEIFGESFPAPFDAFSQRRARNVFNAFHQFDQPVVLVGAGRREADAAIAHDDGGDAMPAGRRDERVPGRLTVIMRVNVHPARRHDMAAGVDFALCRATHSADFGDNAIADGHVCHAGRCPCAVHQCTAANNQIMHGPSPRCVVGREIRASSDGLQHK